MITGNDYSIISATSFQNFFVTFSKGLQKKWESPIIEEIDIVENSIYEYFFARDQQMYEEYEHNGYTLNAFGEGCFMILTRRIQHLHYKIEIKGKEENHSRKEISNPYPADLLIDDAWSYTLVLPSLTEDSIFSKDIYDLFIQSLGKVT